MIDYEKDYSGVWIDLQANVKILHHYCLSGDWETAAKVAKECEADEQGYQYRGNIFENYTSNTTLAVKRRRRWKRTCVRLLDG